MLTNNLDNSTYFKCLDDNIDYDATSIERIINKEKPNYTALNQSAISFGEDEVVISYFLSQLQVEYQLSIEVKPLPPHKYSSLTPKLFTFLFIRHHTRAFTHDLNSRIESAAKYGHYIIVIILAIQTPIEQICNHSIGKIKRIDNRGPILLSCTHTLTVKHQILLRLALTNPELIFSLDPDQIDEQVTYYYNQLIAKN